MTAHHPMADSGIVLHHRCRNVQPVIEAGRKDVKNGVLMHEGDGGRAPWEIRIDNGYPTVVRDPATGILRCFYTTFVIDRVSRLTPLDQRPGSIYSPGPDRRTALAIALSEDGVTWHRPHLGLVEHDGSRDNNLLLADAHGTGVMLDPDDPDPARRYKLVTRLETAPHVGPMVSAFSPDGLHWSTPQPWIDHTLRADTHTAPFRDPGTGRFMLTTRAWRDGVRTTALMTSDDFVHWSAPREILRGPSPRAQIYSMPVFAHAGQLYGLATMFFEGDRDAAEFDVMQPVLATAHDADSWQFADADAPLIERGPGTYPDGAFDSGCIVPSVPVEIDGEHWLYYLGGNGTHTAFRESGLARARIDLDRLVGYRPADPERPGEVVLGPFRFTGGRVEVLADIAPAGQVRWRLLDARSRTEAIPAGWHGVGALTGEGWQELAPDRPFADLPDDEFFLELSLENACVFAVRGAMEHRRFA